MKKQHLLLYIAALLLFSACTGESRRMQALLEQAEEMNRTDQPFLSDSIGKALVHHYDHWWHSRNLRMRAYYMLGCAYRDMGSAPRALENYQRAVSIADTTQADCDLNVLMRVHSQMASLYLQQRLPEQEEQELQTAQRLAWQSGDTLSAFVFEEYLCNLLCNNHKYKSCIKNSSRLHYKYLSAGYKKDAYIPFGLCAKACIAMGDYNAAKKYLDLYESCPYFYTQPEKVSGGLGSLYIYKGEYFWGIRQTDSAEYYFQKAMILDNKLLPYKGLYQVYEQKHEAHSALKYTRLYSEAKEKNFDEAQTEATIQAKAMYDYSIEKELAQRKARMANQLITFLVIAILLIFLISVTFLYRSERKKREISELHRDLETSVSNLREAEEALEALKQEQDTDHLLVESMQHDIDGYREHIAYLETTLSKFYSRKADTELAQSDIVKRFREARKAGMRTNPPTDDDWAKLADSIEKIYPRFHSLMYAKGPLQTKEYRLCLLTKAQFSPSDIDVLMGQKPSYSTNIAKRLCLKVFGFEGSAADFRRKLGQI